MMHNNYYYWCSYLNYNSSTLPDCSVTLTVLDNGCSGDATGCDSGIETMLGPLTVATGGGNGDGNDDVCADSSR